MEHRTQRNRSNREAVVGLAMMNVLLSAGESSRHTAAESKESLRTERGEAYAPLLAALASAPMNAFKLASSNSRLASGRSTKRNGCIQPWVAHMGNNI